MLTATMLRTLMIALTVLLLVQSSGESNTMASPDDISPSSMEAPKASASHLVTQIGLVPRTPNILQFNQNVAVSFRYNTTEAGGVRIWARPFTGNALTPNYAACPSPLYAVGSGSGTCTFTITDGTVTVTRIRFQIWNANATTLLFESFIPVHYQFR